MAEEKKEMIHVIPLKDAWKVAYKKRAKKCVHIIREFGKRHMKNENIKIGRQLNEAIWQRGSKNPPRKVRVQAVPHEGAVWIELVDVTLDLKKKEEKKGKVAELKDKLVGKKEEKPKEAPKEEKKEEAKKEEVKPKEKPKKAPTKKKATAKKEGKPKKEKVVKDTIKEQL